MLIQASSQACSLSLPARAHPSSGLKTHRSCAGPHGSDFHSTEHWQEPVLGTLSRREEGRRLGKMSRKKTKQPPSMGETELQVCATPQSKGRGHSSYLGSTKSARVPGFLISLGYLTAHCRESRTATSKLTPGPWCTLTQHLPPTTDQATACNVGRLGRIPLAPLKQEKEKK